MYDKPKYIKSKLKGNDRVEGETIEMKVERIVSNKEPIKDGAPLIYTERGTGVEPGYNIRTDRFEIATEAATLIEKNAVAMREQRANLKVIKNDNGGEPGGEPGGKSAEPSQ